MLMKVQNFDTIFLQVDQDTNEVFLPKDRFLAGRKITDIFLFSSNEITAAPNGVALLPDVDLKSLYIDLYEQGKDVFVKNLAVQNLMLSNQNRTIIDRVIDFDLSRFKFTSSPTHKGYICVGVLYCDTLYQYTSQATSNVTIEVPVMTHKLSEIGGYQLNGKRIKKINAVNSRNCYLSLRTKEGVQLNEIPLALFDYDNNFGYDLTFDNIEIDSDLSFTQSTNGYIPEITFNY